MRDDHDAFTFAKLLKYGFAFIIVIALLGLLGRALGWLDEAASVAQEEFGPRAMLKKYEWFKDAAATLDARKQSIAVLEQKANALIASYNGVPRKDWDRIDKQNLNIWQQEIAGLILSYNSLAAEWNAQISKFNWKPFVDRLPDDAPDLLARRYQPYTGSPSRP